MFKTQNKIGPTTSLTGRFGHLYWGYYGLPFDFAQDREPAERLVEPFRISDFRFIRVSILVLNLLFLMARNFLPSL